MSVTGCSCLLSERVLRPLKSGLGEIPNGLNWRGKHSEIPHFFSSFPMPRSLLPDPWAAGQTLASVAGMLVNIGRPHSTFGNDLTPPPSGARVQGVCLLPVLPGSGVFVVPFRFHFSPCTIFHTRILGRVSESKLDPGDRIQESQW